MVFKVAKGKEYIGTRTRDFHGPGLEESCGRQNAKTHSDHPSWIIPFPFSASQPVTMKRCDFWDCYFLWQKGDYVIGLTVIT